MVFPVMLLALLLMAFGAVGLYMLFHPSRCPKHGIPMDWRPTIKQVFSPFSFAANDLSPNSPYDMELYCAKCEEEKAQESP
jgi:hypothetical protein